MRGNYAGAMGRPHRRHSRSLAVGSFGLGGVLMENHHSYAAIPAEDFWWFDLSMDTFRVAVLMPVLRTSQKVYKFVGNPGHQSPEYSN